MKDEEVGEVVFAFVAFMVFVVGFSIGAGIVSLLDHFKVL